MNAAPESGQRSGQRRRPSGSLPRLARRRTPTGARCSTLRALPRQGASRGLCHLARRGRLSLLDPHHAPHPGWKWRAEEAPQPTPPSPLQEAGTAGHRTQSGLDLGHNQVAEPGQMDVLLPLRHPRNLQALRGRLDGGLPRVRRAGPAADFWGEVIRRPSSDLSGAARNLRSVR